jgi:putative copper resistance protein D
LELLVDVFGYLSIVLHGMTIAAQSMALGGTLFLILLARPLAAGLGIPGSNIVRGTCRIAAWSAAALVLTELTAIAMQSLVLISTVGLSPLGTLTAHFVLAGLVKVTAAACLAWLLFRRGAAVPSTAAPAWTLLLLAAAILIAATLTTHAAARLDSRVPLLAAAWLHQFGAALWIGGIPSFLLALYHVQDASGWRLVGARFSRMSMAGVASILVSGIIMCVFYIGDAPGFYGTAYGVMVSAKITMFAMLLGLGGLNFLLVERLRAAPGTPITRLRRFAEVEAGIGAAIFFAAASLTSVPPAVDLTQDRVTWAEIIERNTPVWPRFASPDRDSLALPAMQARLDAEAAHRRAAPQAAFIPGAGELPPRNANDIAWSEYNHHWAGLFVALAGFLALLHRAGIRWARHWPLVFMGLGVFLFFRSDPEVWPLGDIGFWDSLRDVEVLQHRFYVVLIAVFAWFEWRVRTVPSPHRAATLVFPLLCAGGGVLLLTHSHAIANVKDQLLIELTHTPLALAGLAAGWARWLELRLNASENPAAIRVASWVWPVCVLGCGLLLLTYREA